MSGQMPGYEREVQSRWVVVMPGLLSKLMVDVGQEVKRGQDIAVVEAMKMENVLRAERDGTVSRLQAMVGDTLAVDQPILEFEEVDPE